MAAVPASFRPSLPSPLTSGKGLDDDDDDDDDNDDDDDGSGAGRRKSHTAKERFN